MKQAIIFTRDIETTKELITKTNEIYKDKKIKVAAIIFKEEEAKEISNYGADEIYLIENLNKKPNKIVTETLAELIKSKETALIIMESTKDNREIAARLAAKINAGYITDCINFKLDKDDKIIGERYVYASKAIEKIKIQTKTAILTIPKRTFKAEPQYKKEGKVIKINIKEVQPEIEILEIKKKRLEGIPLESAERLVVIGRGVKKKEDCNKIIEFAKELKAQVSCSRPIAADLKWFNEWVGLSGHKVNPKLYVGVGVSGAIQHLAGIQGSKIIVAVNKDPEAPIFQAADYGILGDLYQIIPKIIEEIKNIRK